MKKVLLTVLAVVVLLLTFIGVGVANAEENGGAPSVTSTSGLDVHPMSPEKAAKGFVKLGDDLTVLGKGLVVPLSVGGVLLGAVCLLFGVIFSKKLLIAGCALFGISLLLWFFLGDLKTTIEFFSSFGAYLRSLWK